MGLNHIPFKPTNISVSIATVLDAFTQFAFILNLEKVGLPMEEVVEWVRLTCLDLLKVASRSNKWGLKFSGSNLLQTESVKNEIQWLIARLYCAGLDKASNNVCFIYIKHIRLLELKRLSGSKFAPCMEGSTWILPSQILEQVTCEIKELVPDLSIPFLALTYLMSTYKVYKNKYQWLTNAFRTIYSNIAHLLTIVTMQVLE